MTSNLPQKMGAAALDRFGGPELIRVQSVPVPRVGRGEVLVHVKAAGIGEWDPFEREGGYAQMTGVEPTFPYILGSEGAGIIAAVGPDAGGFTVGDRVYAVGFLNPKGGFYAEYAAVDARLVRPVPPGFTYEEAGSMAGVGLTALRGLADVLMLRPRETIVILGANGGVGHVALQLAKAVGAQVIAVASGQDGVALADELGADASVEGHGADVAAEIRASSPAPIDATLLTAGGPVVGGVVSVLRDGGRLAYPNGVEAEPHLPSGLQATGYNADPDADLLERFHRYADAGHIEVHVSQAFDLDNVATAHRDLAKHHLGKFALSVRSAV